MGVLAVIPAFFLACAASGADFFAAPPDLGASLSAEGIYPRGRRLAFMGYSGKPERDLENGFSAAGPVYTDEPAYLEKAFEKGWPVVAHVGRGLKPLLSAPEGLDEAKVFEAAGAQVRALAERPEIVWWAVTPEELRPWRRDEMRYLAAVSSAVRVNDPLSRPIYLYNPNHRGARELEPVARQVDIVAKGAYVNHMGHKRDRLWVAHQIRDLKEAVSRAGRSGAIPLLMPELCADPAPEEDDEIRSWVRHDIYLGLAAGAKGVLIWSLFRRPEVRRTWTLWYEAYSETARELRGELGQVFLFGEPRSDLRIDHEGGGRLLTKAEYAWGPARWLVLVNSSSSAARLTVQGYPPGSAIDDALSESPLAAPKQGPLRVELPGYGVAALRFTEGAP